ncbi:hypothetical protein [Pseudomonas syringae]|uniref:hypothetical protein n=1 Tax=Pseudomonas syringae TaxID=317 RepID=UPI0018E5DC41|nr:hypothetical protein [Pseudomonas syringae]MBI6749766.1 hypothetical protein [Pseudomonas syringae]MBI6771789.1 hypothetical protein [Pseudomonas syringae]MBI6775226.1 hypothetical protein [Pseudomonas syringae]MBI6793005.1 hypothetical protein [Pseudomonas syringae]MBI6800336.1 hypothetical protein [Pseudomonas syringae]
MILAASEEVRHNQAKQTLEKDLKKDWLFWLKCALLFSSGVICGMIPDKKGFFLIESVHDLFEIFGALATVIAAVVAVVALSGWRSQFRHAARFESLKSLKDAATKLHTFRKYLKTVEARYAHLIHNQGIESNELIENEESARQQWANDLQAYNQAWGTAVVFFSPEEESEFSGAAPVYVRRSLDDPFKIVAAYANATTADGLYRFTHACRDINEEVRHLYAKTVSELEWMLRQKYKQ